MALVIARQALKQIHKEAVDLDVLDGAAVLQSQ